MFDNVSLGREAARVIRRKKRKARKAATRFPHVEKRAEEIAKDTTYETPLDRDATMCQYLLAKRLVRCILEYNCLTDRKDIRDIAEVILKRLTLPDERIDAQNGDRTTQQLRLLADVVACWIADVLVEVAKTREEALKKYCEKRRMKRTDVDDDVDDETDVDSKQIALEIKQKLQQDNAEEESERPIEKEEDEQFRETEEIEVRAETI